MNVTIIKSKRRTISIQVNEDASVTVRAPRRMSNREIEKFLKEKDGWIQKHVEKVRAQIEKNKSENIEPLTDEDIRELVDKALEIIPRKVAYYAEIIGVSYGRITIRNQKTRWGSCSAKGNLNFNCLLMLTPNEVIDYVVVHELCHRKEMNHSKAFWSEVEKVIPNYRKLRKWLSDEGHSIFLRRS